MAKFFLSVESDDPTEFKDLIRPFIIAGSLAGAALAPPPLALAPEGDDPQPAATRTRRTKAQIEADAAAAAKPSESSASTSEDQTASATSTGAAAGEKVEFQNAEPLAAGEVTAATLKDKITAALTHPKSGGISVLSAKLKEIAGTMSVAAMTADQYPAVNAYLDEVLSQPK